MNAETVIQNIVTKYFKQGRADMLKTEGIAEIKQALKRLKIPFSGVAKQIYPITKAIENELQKQFLNGHLKPTEDMLKQELKNIIIKNSSAVTELQEKIEVVLLDSLEAKNVELALEKGLSKIKIEQRHINTEIFTTKLALSNLKRSISYKSAGVKRLQYVGPSGTVRPFCEEHINKIYTYEEVVSMVNQFGRPAIIYCGDYNCRHRWRAVIE